MQTLPEIKRKEIEKAKTSDDAWDFLSLFTGEYIEMADKNHKIMEEFNASQHTLLAYNYFEGQVCNGGFIQLIHNGYGGYIFDNPFAEALKLFGAEETAKIVEEAKVLYDKYKENLEKECSIEEFSALYKEITDFEPLENRFYKIMDQETKNIKKYVEENIEEFAVIK